MTDEQAVANQEQGEDLYAQHVHSFLDEAETDVAKAVTRFGFSLWHTVDPKRAQSFKDQLGLETRSANDHYNRGTMAAQNGDLEKAVEAFKAAVKMDPDHGLAVYNQAVCLENLGRKKDARKAYEQYLEILDRAQGRVDLLTAADGDLAEERARVEAHLESLQA